MLPEIWNPQQTLQVHVDIQIQATPLNQINLFPGTLTKTYSKGCPFKSGFHRKLPQGSIKERIQKTLFILFLFLS